MNQYAQTSRKTVNEHTHEHCAGEHTHEHAHVPHVVPAAAADGHAEEHRTRQTIVSMDTLGIAASSVCLVHCLAMPFLIASLPLLGLQFLQGHLAHQVLAFFVITFGLVAILPGYLKHRNINVLGGMIVGLSCVLCATFLSGTTIPESWELPLITVGNLILVASHFCNRQLCRCIH